MTAERRLPAWAAWSLGVGFIVIAWFVTLATPGEDQAQSAFTVPATVGEEATGRNLAVTITDLRRAAEVRADGWSAEGNWLIVDLDAAAVVAERGASLSHAMLEVDGVRFSASDRPDSLTDATLSAGVPLSGSLAFELPGGLDAGSARLELALNADTRLDSMVVLAVDLADVPDAPSAELSPTDWTNP
ncbi:DUF4352 domain-containing protein [Microbacterium hibisci]|uniref:DUF4352 domain-containing protein n=1 Tax=Microbacterium hibisci TaxID=2036000 RepID=UPI001EF37578|nr:DUF4352 domain-containing protein [Microbacterium hibisci]